MALGIKSKHVAVIIFKLYLKSSLCNKDRVRLASYIKSLSIGKPTGMPHLKTIQIYLSQ